MDTLNEVVFVVSSPDPESVLHFKRRDGATTHNTPKMGMNKNELISTLFVAGSKQASSKSVKMCLFLNFSFSCHTEQKVDKEEKDQLCFHLWATHNIEPEKQNPKQHISWNWENETSVLKRAHEKGILKQFLIWFA